MTMKTDPPWLLPLMDSLLKQEAGIVAGAVLKYAAGHGTVQLDGGVLQLSIPLDHPHWELVNMLDLRSELARAGRAWGIESVQINMGPVNGS